MPDTRPPLLGSTPFRGLLILFAIISLLVLDYFVLKNSREQARARAEENLQTTAFALAQHVERTIEQADEMGRVIREQFVRGENYSTFLQLYKRVESKLYVQFAFIDAQGITRFSTVPGWKPIDLSDRKHFRVHADGDGKDFLYISTPVLGRVSNKLTLQLSRRIDSVGGKFLGVVVISINPEEFTSIYRKLAGDSGVISLIGLDGVNRIRVDKNEIKYGQDLSKSETFKRISASDAGVLAIKSEFDDQFRLLAFQQIPRYSLYVTASKPMDEIETKYMGSHKDMIPWLSGIIVITVLLLFLLSIRAQTLNSRLRDSNRLLATSITTTTRANEAKTQFLASVSHELRTPLHGILGHSQLLTLEKLPPDAQDSAKSIFESAGHLLEIVNQLLDLSKAESGHQELDIEEVDLHTVVDEVVTLQKAEAARRNLALTVEWAPRVPQVLNTDRVALKRIIHNLIDNALKFTEKGSIRIQVTADSSALRFAVIDTGIGIADENHAELFDSYTQVHEFHTRSIQGSGLGLALTQKLVKLLGGEIGLSSGLGAGSEFWFTLPLTTSTEAGQ